MKCVYHLKLKDELVKYGGLSKSLRFRHFLTSFMLGKVTLDVLRIPLRRNPSLVPLHRVTSSLYSSRLKNITVTYIIIEHMYMWWLFIVPLRLSCSGYSFVNDRSDSGSVWVAVCMRMCGRSSDWCALWTRLLTATNHIDRVIIMSSWIE